MWSSAINTRNNVTTDAELVFMEQTLTGLSSVYVSPVKKAANSRLDSWLLSFDIGFDRGGKGNIDSYTLWGLMLVGSIRTVPMLMGW